MQISAPQLAGHLQRTLKPLYILHGDDPLLQQEAADAIRSTAKRQGYSERTVFTVAGAHFDWSAVLAAGGTLSLFADKQLLEIRLPSGKPGKEGAAVLQQLAQHVADDDNNLILVCLPRLDAATQKSSWFTALTAHGVVVKIEPVERAQLPAWIALRLQRQGQQVAAGEEGQRTLSFMADRVEGNLLAAHQEIQKLALLYPSGELQLAQIERAVLNVARYDPFKLTEAVLDGQVLRVQRMLDGLAAEGEAAVLVHWALAEDIRALYRAKRALAEGKALPQVLREQRIWGAKEKRFERLLPHLQMVDLGAWLQAAHVVDGIVKGLKAPDWPTDPWQALHRLAIQMCQGCKTRSV